MACSHLQPLHSNTYAGQSITWTEYFHVTISSCLYLPTTHVICCSIWLKNCCSISNIKCCQAQSHFYYFYLKCKYATICNNFINLLSLSLNSDRVGGPHMYMSSWMSEEGGVSSSLYNQDYRRLRATVWVLETEASFLAAAPSLSTS